MAFPLLRTAMVGIYRQGSETLNSGSFLACKSENTYPAAAHGFMDVYCLFHYQYIWARLRPFNLLPEPFCFNILLHFIPFASHKVGATWNLHKGRLWLSAELMLSPLPHPMLTSLRLLKGCLQHLSQVCCVKDTNTEDKNEGRKYTLAFQWQQS